MSVGEGATGNEVEAEGRGGGYASGRERKGEKKERAVDPPLVGGKINDGRALNLAREIN